MESKLQTMPNSPQAWEDLLAANARQTEVIARKSDVITEQKKRIEVLEEYLRLERHKRFGASSERNPNQGEIFNEA